MRKLLSLVALGPKCITCAHFIKAGKCKMFPAITNLNDDIVYGYDYIHCTTARSFPFMCGNGKYYEKLNYLHKQKR